MDYRIEIIHDDGHPERPLILIGHPQRLVEVSARQRSRHCPSVVEIWGTDEHGDHLLSRAIDGKLSRA